MSKSQRKSVVTLSLAGIVLGLAGPRVDAHTTIQYPAHEGTVSYNAAVIGHGCINLANGKRTPVVAQSIVVPTVNPVVTRSDGTPTTLAAEFSYSDYRGTFTLDTLANQVQFIQDKSIFDQQEEITDANGNVIGAYGKRGKLNQELYGLVPFRLTAINFNPESCAKSLNIVMAIADVCKLNVFPPRAGTANLWIPAATSTFSDTGIDGIGEPAGVLTVNRDVVKKPLPAGCAANADGTTGYDVTISPSAEDVDAHLPFKGWGKK